MNKREYIATIEGIRQEIEIAEKRIVELKKLRDKIALDYAEEHFPEIGMEIGQEVVIDDFDGRPKTVFFGGARAEAIIHPDGNLYLEFCKAKKDGTPSKVRDYGATRCFKVAD